MEPAGGSQGGEVVPRAAPVLMTQETNDPIVQSSVKSAVAVAVRESTDASAKAVADANAAAERREDVVAAAAAAASAAAELLLQCLEVGQLLLYEKSSTTRRSP